MQRQWLKDLRTEKGLTVTEAARKLELSQPYYSLIEAGERQKRLELSLAAKIADLYHITIDQILRLDK